MFYLEIITNESFIDNILKEEFKKVDLFNKNLFCVILRKCLAKDPKDRPNSEELLKIFETYDNK